MSFIVNPDGSTGTATRARLVPRKGGVYRTSFPPSNPRRKFVPFFASLVPAPTGSQVTIISDAELPEDPDEPILVAKAACEVLSAHGTVFRAGGFGDPEWKVDVYTDLAVIVPQLQEASEQLQRRQPAELAFYEQGVERSVFITPNLTGDQARLVCESFGDWVAPQPEETAELSGLTAMLRAFERDIAQETHRLWPEISAYDPFADWLRLRD